MGIIVRFDPTMKSNQWETEIKGIHISPDNKFTSPSLHALVARSREEIAF